MEIQFPAEQFPHTVGAKKKKRKKIQDWMQWRGQFLKNRRGNCNFQCKSAVQNTENSRKHDTSKGSDNLPVTNPQGMKIRNFPCKEFETAV